MNTIKWAFHTKHSIETDLSVPHNIIVCIMISNSGPDPIELNYGEKAQRAGSH